ncbi:creatininase family protein [Nocardioides sp. NPDC047086]|uniref:creatininase family protein n=1 Tax=Nocardioides sp. NPDC047086 TaxID=3154810 RepID=UPI0033FED4D7
MYTLGDATWPQVHRGSVLLVPVGSLEQHGPHLPFDTDTTIATGSSGERQSACWLPCRTEEFDLHAGRTETSLMLHLRPEAVHMDLAEPGDTRPLAEILPLMRAGGVAAVSVNGVLGDPTGATAAQGAEALTLMIEQTTMDVLAPGGVAVG